MKKTLLRNGKFYEALAIFSFSIFIIIYSIGLGAGYSITLSPALFPMLAGVSLFGLSLTLLNQVIFGSAENNAENSAKEKGEINWKGLLSMIAMTVAYLIFMPIIHFMAATMIYLFCMIMYLGEKELWLAGAVSVGTATVIYYIFAVLLLVRLP